MSDRITIEDIDRREELGDILINLSKIFCDRAKIDVDKACGELIALDKFIAQGEFDSEEKLNLKGIIDGMTATMMRMYKSDKDMRVIELLNDIKKHLNTQKGMER